MLFYLVQIALGGPAGFLIQQAFQVFHRIYGIDRNRCLQSSLVDIEPAAVLGFHGIWFLRIAGAYINIYAGYLQYILRKIITGEGWLAAGNDIIASKNGNRRLLRFPAGLGIIQL